MGYSVERDDRDDLLKRTFPQYLERLKKLALDGPTLPAVRRKVIEKMEECYPFIDTKQIEESAKFAANLAFLHPIDDKDDDWERLDYYLTSKRISALDLIAYKMCCQIWPNEYAREFIDAAKVVMAKDDARKRAGIRHKNSPQAIAKASVHKSWERWQANPALYRCKSDFSLAMLDNHESLTNQQTIERWCRAWEKQTSQQVTPD